MFAIPFFILDVVLNQTTYVTSKYRLCKKNWTRSHIKKRKDLKQMIISLETILFAPNQIHLPNIFDIYFVKYFLNIEKNIEKDFVQMGSRLFCIRHFTIFQHHLNECKREIITVLFGFNSKVKWIVKFQSCRVWHWLCLSYLKVEMYTVYNILLLYNNILLLDCVQKIIESLRSSIVE